MKRRGFLPWLTTAFAHHRRMKECFPDPRIVAARKALAARPPAPLVRVLEQAAASRKFFAEWRSKGLPDLPYTLRPQTLR
jgi:hypothetical protein